MKQKLTLLLTFAILVSGVYAQKNKKTKPAPGLKKGTLVGLAFNVSDFNAPLNFGKNGNASSIKFRDMSKGLSFTYWKGLTDKVDLSAKLNGIFHDYSAVYYGTTGKTEIGLELEPTINVRPFKDDNMWAPFLTVGAGVGLYTNHIGAYVPLGGGIQLNASNTTYFFLQAQYKVSLTKDVLGNSLFYSIGFAQNINNL